jgi:putative transcriptional regulator
MARTPRTRDLGKRPKFVPNLALKSYRQQRGLSQGRLAELAGVEQGTISKLENGEIRTTADLATKLAEHLGRQPRDLFPQVPGSSRPNEDEFDQDLMRRAAVVARRYARDDDLLFGEIWTLAYALLNRITAGVPLSDDERTLQMFDTFLQRIRSRIPPDKS